MIKLMKAPAVGMALLALAGCGIFKGGGKKTPTVGDRVPILVAEDDISADPALKAVEVLLPAPTVNAAWSKPGGNAAKSMRSEEHTSELQSLMRISYAVSCLKTKNTIT